MGDLSGGRVLHRRAKRALMPERDAKSGSDAGLEFYIFKHIPNKEARAFKDRYRAALDRLALDASQAEAVIAEANIAFLLNMRIFSELDVAAGDAPATDVVPLADAVAALEREAARAKAVEEKWECPFAKMGLLLGMKNPHAENGDKRKSRKSKTKGKSARRKREMPIHVRALIVALGSLAAACFLWEATMGHDEL
jgi:hypothetical protein